MTWHKLNEMANFETHKNFKDKPKRIKVIFTNDMELTHVGIEERWWAPNFGKLKFWGGNCATLVGKKKFELC